jgi:hypothetical protein
MVRLSRLLAIRFGQLLRPQDRDLPLAAVVISNTSFRDVHASKRYPVGNGRGK